MAQKREITLTQGQIALVGDDREWLSKLRWCAAWNPRRRTFYAVRQVPTGPYQQRTIYMHKAIWERHNGPVPDGFTVDHINRVTLDNQISNLRLATNSQQKQNQGLNGRNTSGYRGVYWNKRCEKWHAQIMVDGKRIHLGYFVDKKEAALAYDAVARIHFGEFAQLNFPTPGGVVHGAFSTSTTLSVESQQTVSSGEG